MGRRQEEVVDGGRQDDLELDLEGRRSEEGEAAAMSGNLATRSQNCQVESTLTNSI